MAAKLLSNQPGAHSNGVTVVLRELESNARNSIKEISTSSKFTALIRNYHSFISKVDGSASPYMLALLVLTQISLHGPDKRYLCRGYGSSIVPCM